MSGAQDERMALAVCRAGGIGSLPAGMLSLAETARQIRWMQAHTQAPFNVNFFCHSVTPPTAAEFDAWHQLLQKHLVRYGLDAADLPRHATRFPFSSEHLELLLQLRPPIVSFHYGLPQDDWLRALKQAGMTIWSSATTLAEARFLAAHGVDAVIAQGFEAGGHRGCFLDCEGLDLSSQLGLFALLPQVVDAVNVPVIAAGGIVDQRGIRAALALGAQAVQMGTVYLLCDESLLSEEKRKILENQEMHTQVSNLYSGRPARGVQTDLMRELGAMRAEVVAFPYASAAIHALQQAAAATGSTEFLVQWSGENRSACRRVSAETLTRALSACLRDTHTDSGCMA